MIIKTLDELRLFENKCIYLNDKNIRTAVNDYLTADKNKRL